MTPKEKAQDLVDRFTPHAYGVWDKNGSKEERYHAKQCALVAVGELIQNVYDTDYWFFVKQEIKKL